MTCFPCGEMVKSWESLMCLDRSALVLLFSRGLCHHWPCLKQGGLGCKISLAGQSQAQAAPKWPEVQQNKEQVWGCCSKAG